MSHKSETYDIIVKNLSAQVTNSDLLTLFGKYGSINGISIKDSKLDNKKYAFIRFGTDKAAEEAIISCNNLFLNSNRIFVSKAEKRDSTRNEDDNLRFKIQLNGTGDNISIKRQNIFQQDSETTITSGIQEEKIIKMIMITHVETACLIYAQDEADVEESSALDTKISQIVENLPQLLGTPQLNKIYVTKFSLDGIWYRCQIFEIINRNEVDVLYCDYGNREIVNVKDLFVLPDMFTDIKPFAKCYQLYGVKPIDAQPTKNEAIKFMETYQNKLLRAILHPKTYGPPAITICNEVGSEINVEMIELGLVLQDIPQTINEVNTHNIIKNGRPIIKSERNEALLNENKTYAQQLKKLIEEKQELEKKIDKLNKITFTKKIEMVQVLTEKIHLLRKKFSTDKDVEDVIDTAIAAEACTSDLKLRVETTEKN